MMRRLFWMIAGALLGVTGYRKVSGLARAITAAGRRRTRPAGSRGADLARSAARFARDVRDGMELYTDRHLRLAGHTLGGQQVSAGRLHQAGAGGRHPGPASPGVDNVKDGR